MKTVVFMSVLLLFSCCKSSTFVTSSWEKQDAHPVTYSNILVVALVDKNRSYLEKAVEENVVTRIREKGYNASAYYDLYGAADLGKNDESTIVNNLENSVGSAILTITLLDTVNKEHFISADANYETMDEVNTRFIGYFTAPYEPSYSRRYMPGYFNTDTRYYWETKLYTAVTNELIYSAITDALDPGSSDELADVYSRATVKDMQQRDIFLKPRARRQLQASQSAIAKK